MHSLARMRTFIQKHPALSYFVLTFAISWGSVLAIVGPGHLHATKDEFTRLLPLWVPVLVLGPSTAGILLTWLVGGRPGLRAYRARLFKWRVDARWYAAAILTAPLYFTAVSLVLATSSPAFLPAVFSADDAGSLLRRGIPIALAAGIFEELGWTGFAIPAIRRRHGATAAGLVVGGLWGTWHFLPKVWGAAAFDLVPYLPIDLLCAVVGLTGYRILMAWVYDRTDSLLLGILMHTALTASTLILQPLVSGAPLVTLSIALAIAPWLIVAAVAGRNRARWRGERRRAAIPVAASTATSAGPHATPW